MILTLVLEDFFEVFTEGLILLRIAFELIELYKLGSY